MEAVVKNEKILVFIGEGIGNIIQMLPSVIALHKTGYTVDVVVRSNYAGIKDILQIEEINKVFNVYAERVPNPKLYSKIVLTMFGHLEHYKNWKEEFDGIEVIQDLNIQGKLGKKNDVEIAMDLAREIGYEGPTPDVKISYRDNSCFEYFDNIICPGSGGVNKRWPYFMEFAKQLKGRVGIIGGPAEEKIAWPPNCVDMSGLLSLDETAAIISKAGIYIGNDSGITHLANAVGTPVVAIWGPSNIVKSRPWNKNIIIVSKQLQCQPCFILQTETPCEKKGYRPECLFNISINDVLVAVDKVRDDSDYRSRQDYIKYWERYQLLNNKEEETKVIKEELDKYLETEKITGETCLDFGCGKGDLIPVLNKYFKKIDAVDIIDYKDKPELNGVTYKKIELEENIHAKYDCIFLSRVLTRLVYNNRLESLLAAIKDKFNRIIIVDKVSDLNKPTKKEKPLDLAYIQEKLGIELVTESEFSADKTNISILSGVRNDS